MLYAVGDGKMDLTDDLSDDGIPTDVKVVECVVEIPADIGLD